MSFPWVFLPGIVGPFIGRSGFFFFKHSFGNCLHNIAFNVGNSKKRRENTRLWMCVCHSEETSIYFRFFLSFSVYFYVAFVWATSFKCQRNSITVSNNAWVFSCHLNNISILLKKYLSVCLSFFFFHKKTTKKKK